MLYVENFINMIKTFVGLPGSGKSLYFSYLIGIEIDRIKKNKSRYDIVCINFDWNNGKGDFARYDYLSKQWECGGLIKAYNDFPDLYATVNALVFVDEAGYLFNAMDWDKMDSDYKHFLIHHRKNITDVRSKRFDIYIATQHKQIVEITLRRLSNNIYWIRPLFMHKNPDRAPRLMLPVVLIYYYKEHEIRMHPTRIKYNAQGKPETPSEDDELEILKLIHVYWIGARYRRYYNTLQKIDKVKRAKIRLSFSKVAFPSDGVAIQL